MRSFLLRAAVVAAALVAIARVAPQIVVPGDPVRVAGLAALFGVANAFVRPVVHLLALPIRLVTLGLASFFLNAALVLGVAWAAAELEVGFSVGGYPPDLSLEAVAAAAALAAVLGLVSTVASLVLPGR